MKATLLLRVEGREPVEVCSFEPINNDTINMWRVPAAIGNNLRFNVNAALTVEVREHLKGETNNG